jgi:putative acetyltransferase
VLRRRGQLAARPEGENQARPTMTAHTVSSMEIRDERADDHPLVRQLHVAAFGGQGPAVGELLDGLRPSVTADSGLSLVAADDGAVVGHVLFTRSLLDAPTRLVEVQVLSPIAVLPEQQRRGIGSALIREGVRVLADRQVPLVFLEGSPAYYSRLGFRPGAELGFRKPSLRIPDAAFQVLALPAYQSWMTGTLVYSSTFWEYDAVGLRDTQ